MDNLIFCLNVTVPIFLTLLLGYFFRRIGLFDETFVNRMNKFVFVIPLPVLLLSLIHISGKEVVQLYVKDCTSSAIRPEKELKGFEKVFLNPGETKTVTMELDKRSFAWYNTCLLYTSQPYTFMCSYNQINGTFASENKWLLTDVLRGDWGFKGYVMSVSYTHLVWDFLPV